MPDAVAQVIKMIKYQLDYLIPNIPSYVSRKSQSFFLLRQVLYQVTDDI